MDYSKAVTGFTKLFSGIIFSTVWREEMHVKVVWITMLALADRNGVVNASVPGLADASRVTVEQCREALARFMAPDEDSRTKEFDGRRAEVADGGWRLLNYLKYRELMSKDERRIKGREYVANHRSRKQVQADVSDGKQSKHIAEAEAEAEADTKAITTTTALRAPSWLSHVCDVYERHYGAASFPYGKAGKILKPLHEAGFSGEEIASRFDRYANALDDIKYLSLAKFRESFAGFAENAKTPKDTKGQTAGQRQFNKLVERA
jgi:hypothetical protein